MGSGEEPPAEQPSTRSAQRGRTVTGRERTRPDPRPARLMVVGGAVAALALFVAGLVRPPAADTADATGPSDGMTFGRPDATTNIKREPRVRYVRLKPGQKPPAGARVIQEAPPPPRVVVRSVPAPSQRSVRIPVARTRQSGG
jgi:hypothetical protein